MIHREILNFLNLKDELKILITLVINARNEDIAAIADSVIVPVQAHYLHSKGMTQLIKTISKVKKLNPSLKADGILLTLADMRTNFARLTDAYCIFRSCLISCLYSLGSKPVFF